MLYLIKVFTVYDTNCRRSGGLILIVTPFNLYNSLPKKRVTKVDGIFLDVFIKAIGQTIFSIMEFQPNKN